jgi:predicted SprT family Zn-dependent metalloprotease
MKRALEDKMIEVLSILENHYKKPMPIPTIVFIPRMGLTLGKASRLQNCVKFNQDLCTPEHWHHIFDTTLAHEVCHLVAPVIYNRWRHGADRNMGWGHGRAWKECMRVVGLPPDRCGNLGEELRQQLARRTVVRKYVYTCNCETPHILTAILHKRIQNGSNRRCLRCKTRIVFKGEKIDA